MREGLKTWVRALNGFSTLKVERREKRPRPPRDDNRCWWKFCVLEKPTRHFLTSPPGLCGLLPSSLPALGVKATSWYCRFLNFFLWRRLSPSSQTALKKFPDPDDPGAAPLSHRQHRYQSQRTDYMAFSLRSKRLSIPKGEEPGFTAAEFSRSFRETRSFDHLAALGVHSPKGRRISAAIPGTEPRKLPSPRRPGFSPDRCVFICAAKTAGFKIARVPGSVCAPQGRRSEPEHRLGAGKEPPTLRLPGQQELAQVCQSPATVSEKFASFTEESLREGRGSQAGPDTCWHLSSIPGACHQALPGLTLSGKARPPPPPPPRRTAAASSHLRRRGVWTHLGVGRGGD